MEEHNKPEDAHMYNSQAGQDRFVLSMLNYKRNGYFVEIGSAWPRHTNNSWILEKQFGWSGIMVEIDPQYLPHYKIERQNSVHVIHDATKVDYPALFRQCNSPRVIDYLQIDLDVDNRSTLDLLELFDKHVFDLYTFATITFEHDIYRGDYFHTRAKSREIFTRRGYVCLFDDIEAAPGQPFEDWWVKPELVDNFVAKMFISKLHPNIPM